MEKALKASGAECGYKGLSRDWTNVKGLKLPFCPKKSLKKTFFVAKFWKNTCKAKILKKRGPEATRKIIPSWCTVKW